MTSAGPSACILLIYAGFAPLAAAQATMPFDHVHIAVSDPAKATEWYAEHLGGSPGPAHDRVFYGNVIVAFQRGRADTPPSSGSAIDHIGFSVTDLDARLVELRAGGARILQPRREVPGLFSVAVVEDPWGAKIELIQQDSGPVSLHHIHLRVLDPADSLSWYRKMFGGERGMLNGQLEGVRYGDVWLLAESCGCSSEPPGTGHAIDHLGWRPENVDAKIAELKARGATIISEPRAYNDLRFAFVEAPAGIRIELTQRPPAASTGR